MASKELLEEIRNRLPLVSFVGERIPLKKSGRNFKGLCPFHQEKSPSFMVNEDKQIFHCFGCSAGGDIFTFVMKLDGLSFPEALDELAAKAGVKLPVFEKGKTPDADDETIRRKKWALRLNEIVMQFFIKNLSDETAGGVANDYLKERGITPETAKQHFLGYADKSWDALVNEFTSAQAPLKLALELGLIKEREKGGGYYDFYRGRLMFPILNLKNEIVGFGGRTLDPEDGAKYLNSSDSFLYHKSATVYGLNWAKETIRTEDEVILVEGYMDLLALRQAGIGNVVAPLGTALTLDHLRLLMRYTRNFFIAFDGDAAGLQAAFRSLPFFLELGLVPRAIMLPTGHDPDSFIQQEGVPAWNALKIKAKTLFECFVDDILISAGRGTAATIQSWDKIRPVLQKVTNPLEHGLYLKQVAQKLGVEEGWLGNKNRSSDIGPQGGRHRTSKVDVRSSLNTERNDPYPEEERLLIAAMILSPKVIPVIEQAGDIFTNPHLKNLAKQLFLSFAEEGSIQLTNALNLLDNTLAGWVREMALTEEENGLWEKAALDCLAKIESKTLGVKLQSLNHEIQLAEMQGNEAALLKLMSEKTKLTESKLRKRNAS